MPSCSNEKETLKTFISIGFVTLLGASQTKGLQNYQLFKTNLNK
jgi:hypothetical protein